MKFGKQTKISPEVRDSLKSLGFTDYFTTIFITLLEKGERNAHDLSKITKVPYSRIYEVLNEMVHRHILTKLEGRPSTFLANNPREVFAMIKQQNDASFQNDVNTSLPVLNQLYGPTQSIIQEQITVYHGMTASYNHFRNILHSTAYTIDFTLHNAEEIVAGIDIVWNFLETKLIKARLILETQYQTMKEIEKISPYAEIRYLKLVPETLLVSDNKTAIQCVVGNFNLAAPKDEKLMLYTSNSANYVMFISEKFKCLWMAAEPAKKFK
ncbi:MAG: TrmB family transcriptional regulator [Promethearchaeota archaeon]